MEELHLQGLKNRQILIKFLKEHGIYGDFIKNTYEYRAEHPDYSSMNNIFNTSRLKELFELFFRFSWTEYPLNKGGKSLDGYYKRYRFWLDMKEKWVTYCYYQEYKKYNIW